MEGHPVKVRIHPHAAERLVERGASEAELLATLEGGERFPARLGRTSFRRNFRFNGEWRGRTYAMKQLEAFAVEEDGWLVITVIVNTFDPRYGQ